MVDGLTDGNDYQIQLLMGDTRGCCADRTQTATGGANTSEEFSRAGGSVVGSFTASGDLSLDIAGAADPGLSGYDYVCLDYVCLGSLVRVSYMDFSLGSCQFPAVNTCIKPK